MHAVFMKYFSFLLVLSKPNRFCYQFTEQFIEITNTFKIKHFVALQRRFASPLPPVPRTHLIHFATNKIKPKEARTIMRVYKVV